MMRQIYNPNHSNKQKTKQGSTNQPIIIKTALKRKREMKCTTKKKRNIFQPRLQTNHSIVQNQSSCRIMLKRSFLVEKAHTFFIKFPMFSVLSFRKLSLVHSLSRSCSLDFFRPRLDRSFHVSESSKRLDEHQARRIRQLILNEQFCPKQQSA